MGRGRGSLSRWLSQLARHEGWWQRRLEPYVEVLHLREDPQVPGDAHERARVCVSVCLCLSVCVCARARLCPAIACWVGRLGTGLAGLLGL